MDNIYQETLEKVGRGASFRVDLKKRTLKVDGKVIIDEGKYEGNLGLAMDIDGLEQLFFDGELFYLYERYKHSIPSEKSDGQRRLYFKALPEHELSDDDMLYGAPRELARCELELTLLIAIIDGGLGWPERIGKFWFWQSAKDKDFVILREWVEGK